MSGPVKVGDVIRVAEADYKYGTGILRLSISKVGRAERLADGDWLDLEGFTLRADGTQVSPAPRQVLVRVNALRGAVQRRETKS
jgi:hypothetical protein